VTTIVDKRHCKQCGAPVKKREMTVCWRCGTPYSFLEERAQRPRAERFQAAYALPELTELLDRRPSALGALAILLRPVLAGVLLLAGARLARPALLGEDAGTVARVLVTVLALALGLVALGLVLIGLVRLFLFLRAPLVRRPAVVIGKATLRPGGNLQEAQEKPLLFQVEFRTENKDRVRAGASLSKDLHVDDLGVAYIKGAFLLDFVELDV
jgi:predicted nucleic acid-binding Zn ribbon protein